MHRMVGWMGLGGGVKYRNIEIDASEAADPGVHRPAAIVPHFEAEGGWVVPTLVTDELK